MDCPWRWPGSWNAGQTQKAGQPWNRVVNSITGAGGPSSGPSQVWASILGGWGAGQAVRAGGPGVTWATGAATALSAAHFTAAETQKSWQPCCRLGRWLGGPIAGAFSSARLPSRAHRAQATSSGVQGQRRRMRKKPPCQGGEQHNTVNTCLSSVFCSWGQIRANVSLSQLRLPYVTLSHSEPWSPTLATLAQATKCICQTYNFCVSITTVSNIF